MNTFYNRLLNHPFFSHTLIPIYRFFKFLFLIPGQREAYKDAKKRIFNRNRGKNTVYYLGASVHSNLGDLAQGVCIRRWMHKHYFDCNIIELTTGCWCIHCIKKSAQFNMNNRFMEYLDLYNKKSRDDVEGRSK